MVDGSLNVNAFSMNFDLRVVPKFIQILLLISNEFNTLTANVPYHTETSQLIRRANQLTDFYMMGTLVDKGLSELISYYP